MKKFTALMLSLLMLVTVLPVLAEGELYTVEDIVIDAGDHQIPATLTLPIGGEDETFPAVVMLHGNGSTRHEAGNGYDLMAPAFAEMGIASLRFDYIGNGDSTTDYLEFTHEKGVEDALTSLAYLKEHAKVDPERIGIMGWSQGGGIALVAASRDESFKSVATWAGALYDGTIDEDAYAQAQQNGHYESTYEWRDPLKLSPAYFEVLKTFIVADAIPKIKAPIYAINGADDTVVPPETAETIKSLSTNPDSQVLIMEGADHTFNIFTGDMSKFTQLVDETMFWFVQTL